MSLDLTSRPRDVHDWRDPQALTKSLFPCLLLLSCLPPRTACPRPPSLDWRPRPKHQDLAWLLRVRRPAAPRQPVPWWKRRAGPTLPEQRGVGGNRGTWGGAGGVAPCGTCQVQPTPSLSGLAGLGNSICACRTSGVFAHGPRGHVLLSWPRSAERGQCPGSGVHLSSFSFSWPRMHQLFSSPSSLTPVQAPSCRSGRRAVHHVLASINPSRSVLGENVRDASPAPFLPWENILT